MKHLVEPRAQLYQPEDNHPPAWRSHLRNTSVLVIYQAMTERPTEKLGGFLPFSTSHFNTESKTLFAYKGSCRR